jgi:hypothetical protein
MRTEILLENYQKVSRAWRAGKAYWSTTIFRPKSETANDQYVPLTGL